MNWAEAITLVGAAAAAGGVNAVAGGGTLITFPTLLLLGTPAVIANATNTLAIVVGTSGGVAGYRRQLGAVRGWLVWFVPASLLGGIVGAVLLTFSREKVFSHLVPFLLLFATVIFVAQGAFRRLAGAPGNPGARPHRRRLWAAAVFQFFVAVYGGYFGAGIGILMLASLGFIGLTDIHEMNALKTVLGSMIKLVAAIYFIASGLIAWPEAGVMIVGAVTGYYLAAKYAQRIPQRTVRQIIAAVGFVITAVIFYREFLR